jgi:hypothetical protein
MEQKAASLYDSSGKVSSCIERAVSGIKGQCELLLPIELVTGIAKGVIAIKFLRVGRKD